METFHLTQLFPDRLRFVPKTFLSEAVWNFFPDEDSSRYQLLIVGSRAASQQFVLNARSVKSVRTRRAIRETDMSAAVMNDGSVPEAAIAGADIGYVPILLTGRRRSFVFLRSSVQFFVSISLSPTVSSVARESELLLL